MILVINNCLTKHLERGWTEVHPRLPLLIPKN